MATYGYSTPYTGRGDAGPLPPGYMEAATAPGRNLAMGIVAMGQGLGKALERYSENKKAHEAVDQSHDTVGQMFLQQMEADPKVQAVRYYEDTGKLPTGVDEATLKSYEAQMKRDAGMISNLIGSSDKWADMSLTKKKTALGDAVTMLNQYRNNQQDDLRNEATRQNIALGKIQLGKAQREAEAAPYFTQAIGDVMAMQPGQTPTMPFANVTQEMIAKYGGRLTPDQMMTLGTALRDQEAKSRLRLTEQAMTQVAQLPAQQEVTMPAPPAIISSSLNLPAEQQPYTPFYQVQQVMGGQQQQPDVAAFAQGLGRPVTRIPQRIPIADQPLTAAPAPVPQPLVSTQRVPLRDRQVLQQQQAARPVGIAPIPQREVPAFESQPIQRTATETQPVSYQDRFKQAVDVFQRLGAPINPEAIRSVMEATGTPRPIQVESQTLPGGITVVRADGKVDILPAPKMIEGKDLTEGQSKDAMFAARMTYNEGVINKVLSGGYKPGGIFEFGFTPERLKSDDRKTYESSKENWIEANLRDLSGAAIGTDEYKKADLQYFPQAGDSAKQVQQKAKLRKIVENSLRAGIGRNADFYIQQILGGAQEQKPAASALLSDPRVAAIRARQASGAITKQQAIQQIESLK
jgi:hypothetical protein